MTLLDISIVNVALPTIEAGLDASPTDLQWILTGYAVAFGLVLVSAGRLGDARGRRRVFLIGLTVTVASLMAGLAPAAGWLSGARVVQGIGAGILTPQVAGFIQALFPREERGRAFGALGASIGLSTAAGPLVGGLILDLVGGPDAWRWIFLVNLPVGVVVAVLALRLLPADTASGQDPRLDPVGVGLLGAAVVLVLLPLTIGADGDFAARPWGLLLAGVVCLIAFVGWEHRFLRRGGAPVIDLSLFAHRSYSLGAGLAFCYFAGFTAIFFVLTLTLQTGLGYDPLTAGLVATPFAIGGALAAFFGGRLVSRLGRPLVAVGIGVSIIGVLGTALAAHLVPGGALGWAVVLPQFLAGVGSGLTISPNQTLTLAEVPSAGGGSAAGVVQTGQRIGTAFGIALTGTVFFGLIGGGTSFPAALSRGMLVVAGFMALALVIAVVDLTLTRRQRAPAS
ncbi:MAG: MFS transporter [Geodermatophilaceae bacterium]|nr:MFS transporter [Geodermatophilaceae bacterium]